MTMQTFLDGKVTLFHGDCLEVLRTLPDESVDSVVTDPPAGISFMGRAWDHHKGGRDQWIAWMQEVAVEVLRVCKPGAHALVWALPRTSHWTATAWENAGWSVRDRIVFAFGSGFPKSYDVSAAIDKAAGAEREIVGPKVYADGHVQTYTTVQSNFAPGHQFRWGDEHYSWDELPDAAKAFHLSKSATTMETSPATPEAVRWAGWGTALKPAVEDWHWFEKPLKAVAPSLSPAVEDWWLLRKPLSELGVAANVLKHGTGALNIDGCRVEASADYHELSVTQGGDHFSIGSAEKTRGTTFKPASGRWPANLIHDGSEEVIAAFPERDGGAFPATQSSHDASSYSVAKGKIAPPRAMGDSGSAARFFYSAKADSDDRLGSKHPTVKPVDLLQYLVRLVTPKRTFEVVCRTCDNPHHGAQTLPQDLSELSRGVPNDAQERDVLFDGVPIGKGEETSRSVPCLCEDGQSASRDLLLPKLPSERPEGDGSIAFEAMQTMRCGIPAEPRREAFATVLRDGVCRKSERIGAQEAESDDGARILSSLASRASDGEQEWLRDGAPSSHGGASGPLVKQERSCSPSQRQEDGQPNRELACDAEEGARPAS